MSVYSDHAAQLDALHTEYAEDAPYFTWNASQWKILPGGAKATRELDVGGMKLSSDLQLTCLTAQFGDTLPSGGETITYRDIAYTITSVTPACAGYQIRINADLNVQGM